MAILNNSNAISSGGYDINNSVRLRSSASAYLSRTPASSGNRQKWTYSIWLKKGSIGTEQAIWQAGTAANGDSRFYFATSGAITWEVYNGSTGAGSATTSALYRDFSAWYHVVISVDTTQATSSNRIKLYVNGEQVTSFSSSSYPAQNDNLDGFNLSSATHYIGSNKGSGRFYDGYMTDINFVDGSQLTPSDFGETDSTTGVWKPKAYTGTYGTNGFYLKFSDIATTSGSNAGLGKDFSGNANYFNTNNISVTAGTTYDAMIDSPTLTSATVANYATLNPLMSGSPFQTNAAATVSQGNLQADWTTTGSGTLISTIGMTSGKWYFEGTVTGTNTREVIGILNSSASTTTYAGGNANGWGYFSVNGNKYNNDTGTSYGATYTTNDIIGVAFDADAGTLTFYKNGTSQGTAFTGLAAGTYFFAVSDANASVTCGWNVNFGQRPFSYTPPTGFVRLNTYNLPDSTIKKGNTVMDATLYTGTGSTQTITNAASFKPDFVWVKTRSSGSYGHALFDSVRGTPRRLASNLTEAENTTGSFGQVSSFNSNGFTVATGSSDFGETGANTLTYVGWQWQAGQGTNTSNTSGSITSTVSVNATAGFSVVTWTGTGANATVGHGLGVAPKMLIVKNRSVISSWRIWFTGFAGTELINLNETGGKETGQPATWNSTVPTSTVFSLGTAAAINGNGNSLVAYLWSEIAGFSKFGSYTGNGSADGPFSYFGFRPKFVMIKNITTAGYPWVILDSARNTYNPENLELYPNTSGAEASGGTTYIEDFLSNGFKVRQTDATFNASGSTYIYMAFAENPFKNSNAR